MIQKINYADVAVGFEVFSVGGHKINGKPERKKNKKITNTRNRQISNESLSITQWTRIYVF